MDSSFQVSSKQSPSSRVLIGILGAVTLLIGAMVYYRAFAGLAEPFGFSVGFAIVVSIVGLLMFLAGILAFVVAWRGH